MCSGVVIAHPHLGVVPLTWIVRCTDANPGALIVMSYVPALPKTAQLLLHGMFVVTAPETSTAAPATPTPEAADEMETEIASGSGQGRARHAAPSPPQATRASNRIGDRNWGMLRPRERC